MSHKFPTRTFAKTFQLLLIVGFALGLAPVAHAGTSFTVDTRGDAVDANPGDGLCATVEGRCTLRAAIQETNALPGADTITLPAGSYLLSVPGADEDAAATGDLDITDDLTITGAGRDMTGINGKGEVTGDRVFDIHDSATVTISGVTIGHGVADEGGGGIRNSGSLTVEHSRISANSAEEGGGGIVNCCESAATLTVTQSTLTGNSASTSGGGIRNVSGTLMVTHSTLYGNSTEDNGGGIYNFGFGATVTISHSTLSGNTADGDGGGIYNDAATVTVSHSTLTGNSANFGGGIRTGALDSRAFLSVSHSTLSGNTAERGGGIYIDGQFGEEHTVASVRVTHSTISGNSATGLGGGIYNFDRSNAGTLTVAHSTLSANSAGDSGGGIYNSRGDATIESTILAGNLASTSGPDCAGDALDSALDSAGYNLLGNNSGCTFNASEGDLVGTPDDPIDPLLGPLQNNGGPTFTHALLNSSPAIDTGNPDECPPTDQRGFPRPVDGDGDGVAICDIGSYEYGSAP